MAVKPRSTARSEEQQPAPGRPAFEFTSQHNLVIDTLARRATVWGGISTAGGLLSLTAALVLINMQDSGASGASSFVFISVPQLSVGLSFLAAGRALGAVVRTKGHDIALLMEAISDFTVALKVQIAATVLLLVTVFALAAASRAFTAG